MDEHRPGSHSRFEPDRGLAPGDRRAGFYTRHVRSQLDRAWRLGREVGPSPSFAQRTVGIYKACALIIFNSLVIYILLNLSLATYFTVKDAYKQRSQPQYALDPVTARYGPELLDRVYPGWDRRERVTMLSEIWYRPFIHDDYTHFQERPIAGKYVNVSEAGYRASKDQGPWPPAAENLNVFVFGGSTTFGYGLPDDQTVPSCLQAALTAHAKRRVCIYNFGVGWYHSTPERLRFEKLLLKGYIPEIAIFVDGLNDANRPDNRPPFKGALARAFEEVKGFGASQSPNQGQPRESYKQLALEACFLRLPVGRACRTIVQTLQGESLRMDSAQLELACKVYLTNTFLIEQMSRRHGVTPIFVWQPVPGYKYDLKHHPFGYQGEMKDAQEKFYPMMRQVFEHELSKPNYLWCGDIQQDRAEPLYVDSSHYTAAFSRDFAETIVRGCLERHLLDEHLGPIRSTESAGRMNSLH